MHRFDPRFLEKEAEIQGCDCVKARTVAAPSCRLMSFLKISKSIPENKNRYIEMKSIYDFSGKLEKKAMVIFSRQFNPFSKCSRNVVKNASF